MSHADPRAIVRAVMLLDQVALWSGKLAVARNLVAVEETGAPERVAVADAQDLENVLRALKQQNNEAASASAEQYWLRYWNGRTYQNHPTDDPDRAIEVLIPETARVLGVVENPPAPRLSEEQKRRLR